jgi:hypothetical protein
MIFPQPNPEFNTLIKILRGEEPLPVSITAHPQRTWTSTAPDREFYGLWQQQWASSFFLLCCIAKQ